MARPVTLFTGQWADLPLAELAPLAARMGFDGLELACWGDHFDVRRAAREPDYAASRRSLLEEHGLALHAISNHLVGQAVCDRIDERHQAILPPHVWGDGEPEGVRQRAAEELALTATAARAIGVGVVNGFTGSSVWHSLYAFPPTGQDFWDAGFADFGKRFGPILDAFDARGRELRAGGAPDGDRVRHRLRGARARSGRGPPALRVQLRPVAPRATRASTTSRSSAASPTASSTCT